MFRSCKKISCFWTTGCEKTNEGRFFGSGEGSEAKTRMCEPFNVVLHGPDLILTTEDFKLKKSIFICTMGR